MKLVYPVIFTEDPAGGYMAYVPDLYVQHTRHTSYLNQTLFHQTFKNNPRLYIALNSTESINGTIVRKTIRLCLITIQD